MLYTKKLVKYFADRLFEKKSWDLDVENVELTILLKIITVFNVIPQKIQFELFLKEKKLKKESSVKLVPHKCTDMLRTRILSLVKSNLDFFKL